MTPPSLIAALHEVIVRSKPGVERTALAGAFRIVTVIDYYGDTQVARTLNVRTNDLQRWLAGKSRPPPTHVFCASSS